MAVASMAAAQTPGTVVQTVQTVSGRSEPGVHRVTVATPSPRKSFRIPYEGVIWLAVASMLWATGLYKGINLVTLLGTLMLVLGVLNVVLAGRRVARLQAVLRSQGMVFARTPCRLELEITNTGRRAVLGVRVDNAGASHALAHFLPALRGGRTERLHSRVVLPHRGRYAWGEVRVTTGYPHGLAERGRVFPTGGDQIVCPALGQLHRGRLKRWLARVSAVPLTGRGRPTRRPTTQAEFHGLRTFRPGDSPRWIHWRTSARRGELMVREFEEPPSDNLILVLDPWVGAGDPHSGAGAAFGSLLPRTEDAISLAATICWEWCKEGGHHFVLVVAGREPVVVEGSTGQELCRRLLESLALVPAATQPNPAGAVAALSGRPLPPAAILVIGAGSGGLVEALAAQLRRPVAFLNAISDDAKPFYERGPCHAS